MRVFLDAASGAPLHQVAREALLAALDDGWADPERLAAESRRARLLLHAARESVAESIGARADEVSFAANGVQALQSAALGALAGAPRGVPFVHSSVEHSAVLHCAERYRERGGETVAIAVDSSGRVDESAFARASGAAGTVAALQAANHEVGTRQPVATLASAAPEAVFVVDATQTLGHGDVPDGWSVLAGDARTWGGPSIGLVAVRTGTRWRPPLPSDDHELGRVAGVPNVPAAVAAAASLRAVLADRKAESARTSGLIERVRFAVPQLVPDVEVLGDPVDRLPHIVTFSCLYVDGEALLTELDRLGFAVSSGSSCTSSTLEPSHVLVAMGALTSGNVRVSLHPGVTAGDVDAFLAALPRAVATVRAELGADGL